MADPQSGIDLTRLEALLNDAELEGVDEEPEAEALPDLPTAENAETQDTEETEAVEPEPQTRRSQPATKQQSAEARRIQSEKDKEIAALRKRTAELEAQTQSSYWQQQAASAAQLEAQANALEAEAMEEFDKAKLREAARLRGQAIAAQQRASMERTQNEMMRMATAAGLEPNDNRLNWSAQSPEAFQLSIEKALRQDEQKALAEYKEREAEQQRAAKKAAAQQRAREAGGLEFSEPRASGGSGNVGEAQIAKANALLRQQRISPQEHQALVKRYSR